ncbi:MAG: hypothetical protein ACJAZO_001652 [Myxococcota bacterium]|jgi:hypothetical protein
MNHFAAIAALLFAGCAAKRLDACTPEELGWTCENTCFFDVPATFFSDDVQDCGLSNSPPLAVSRCQPTVIFDQDTVTWRVTDYTDTTSYDCDGNTLTFGRDDVSATWVPSTETLVWNGRDYLPLCRPSASQ